MLMLPAAPVWALQGFGISPTSQEVELAPGGSFSGEVTVINDGDSDVIYRMYASDYKVTGEDYRSSFDSSGKRADVSPVTWFGLPDAKLVIKARAQVKVPYTITAPKTATVGGHYGAIFVETIPPAGKGGAFISRVERVGSLVYITIAGSLMKTGRTLPLDVPWLQSLPPIEGTLRVRNTGNTHFLAEGKARLATPFSGVGKPVAFRGEVLPGTTRRFDLKLPSGSPMGLYHVTATVQYLGKTETMSHWTLLIPRLTFLIVGSTLMLLLGLGFWGLMRRARRR
ncbi:MAG: exported protein of unknown function [Patescibacteria group bacterium]|nr:exported protein of unknown function [Patescibacteria group bacterium]